MKDTPSFGDPAPLTYPRWWDFLQPITTYCFPLETVTAGANANDDVAATLVGVLPAASRLVGGYFAVGANSGGVDAGNASVWVVAVAAATVLSKSNVADLVANTPVSFGTPVITDLAAGGAITLAITNAATADLNSAVCHASLILADYNNFPQPGLKVIASDAGTCTISDGVKGVCVMSPGTADNNEIYVVSTLETVKFLSGKTFIGEWLIQYSEANTDDANIIVGFMNAAIADSLINDGGGPRATGDYVAIWKVDGGTKWRCGVQSNATQVPTTDVDSDVTAGGTSYQRLVIKCVCTSSTRAFAEFWVDGKNIGTIHFDYAGATDMQLVAGAKNGSANAETLNIDKMGYDPVR